MLFHAGKVRDMPLEEDLESKIREVQCGDGDAFEAVVRAYAIPIRAWIVARCPVGGDADDVVQRTFIQAFRKIGEYRHNTNFRAWLFAIARYELLAEHTKLRRLADYHSRYAPYVMAKELERQTEAAQSEELPRLQYLRECLSELGEHARQMVGWRYTDNLPLSEIAARTERTVGAIKKHLFNLRRKLYDCIQRKLTGEEL